MPQLAAASAPSATKGWKLSTRKSRWIAGIVTGVLWSAIAAAMLIQPHIQVYMTIWLATLLASLTWIATLMTRPDHGLLNNVRLKIATIRLDEAITEELAAADETKEHSRLHSVV